MGQGGPQCEKEANTSISLEKRRKKIQEKSQCGNHELFMQDHRRCCGPKEKHVNSAPNVRQRARDRLGGGKNVLPIKIQNNKK